MYMSHISRLSALNVFGRMMSRGVQLLELALVSLIHARGRAVCTCILCIIKNM